MQLRSLAAVLALTAACGAPPHLQDPVRPQVVELAPFSSARSMYLQTVDTSTSALEQLFDHVPGEAPDIVGQVTHWRAGNTHYYVVTAG